MHNSILHKKKHYHIFHNLPVKTGKKNRLINRKHTLITGKITSLQAGDQLFSKDVLQF